MPEGNVRVHLVPVEVDQTAAAEEVLRELRRVTEERRRRRWLEVDMTMHALTLAMHQATNAGLEEIARELEILHGKAFRERSTIR